MNFHVLTLFPEMVEQGVNTSITGRAIPVSYTHLEQQLENVKSDIKKINDTLNKYNNDLADLRVENSRLSKELSENNEKYHKLKSNLETLKNITERYEGYGSSIKKVMELKEGRKGIIGVVADIIKVDKKYEVAIETALGGNIQNIVTDTETTAKDTIEYLKKNKYGRATFLPLSSMSNKTNFNAPDALEEKGVLGLASDLVDIKKEYEGVAKYLLGRVMVVDTIDPVSYTHLFPLHKITIFSAPVF